MGAAEVERLLGVSRQRVQQLVKDRVSNGAGMPFPDPASTLDMGKVWLADDVRRWARDYEPRTRRERPDDAQGQ